MKSKRLFLIAGYNAQNKVDASLVYMLNSFKDFGDIILVMDSDVPDNELIKVQKYVLYASAIRHHEYDFGSYKRAYNYARKENLLKNYDFVYMVNDSVYGPVCSMDSIINSMESLKTDAFGLVCKPHKNHQHIQSWFIGMRPSVFMADWFNKFISSVTVQNTKGAITHLYEQGLSKLLINHGIMWKCVYSVSGRGIYNNIKKLYKSGIPFIKKASFTRHNGALGMQLAYVLNHALPDARYAIITGASETLGTKYIQWLLTQNPVKIIYRNLKYFIHKIFTEEL